MTRDAQLAVDVISRLGGRPLIVGGAVRDHLLGMPSKDIDIEVHGNVSWLQLTESLSALGRVDTVGAAFGVLKFGRDVDISFPRRDSKVRPGHTGFLADVDPTMTTTEALSRRDFTINSIAFDPQTGDFIDPFGGMCDLHLADLRHTSEAFSEDPLRVMRAVQFSSRFMFDIHPDTAELCRSMVNRFSELSVERIWVEWEKILTKGRSMEMVTKALIDTGWIVHFPGWVTGSRATDLVLARADADGITGERRAALILGAHFRGRTHQLNQFVLAIDAPGWLRKASMRLATDIGFNAATVQHSARIIARHIFPSRLDDFLRVRGLTHGLFWAAAEDDGVLEAPHKALLTGAHLIDAGMTPGPAFATLLKRALDAQDREGWTTEAEALAWFLTVS